MFGGLARLAQQKLTRPCQKLTRLGKVQAPVIRVVDVTGCDVVSRGGRKLSPNPGLGNAVPKSKVLVASKIPRQSIPTLLIDQLDFGCPCLLLMSFTKSSSMPWVSPATMTIISASFF